MALPWYITVAWESFYKEVLVGKNCQSRDTDDWENIPSEGNLFTQSLPLFPCSFRLRKPSGSSAGSPEIALRSEFAREKPMPLSSIRQYPAPKSETGSTVALAAHPCPAGWLRCRRKPTAAQMSLSVSFYVERSLSEGHEQGTWSSASASVFELHQGFGSGGFTLMKSLF